MKAMRIQTIMYFHWNMDLPYVLAAKPRCRTEIIVKPFFQFQAPFCELKVVNFPGKEQYFQNWNKEWKLYIYNLDLNHGLEP